MRSTADPPCAWAPPYLWVWQNLLDSDVSASLGTRVSLGIPVSAACLSTWDAAKQTRFLKEPSPLPSCLWHTVRAVLRQCYLCLGILQRFGQVALWAFTYWLPVLWCVGQEAHWREGGRIERVRPRTNPLLYSGLPLSLRMNVSFLDMNDLSVGFSSVTQSCPTLCDPMNRSTPGLPVHHQLPEFTQTHVHRVRDAIQPSHPLSSPSPPAPNPSQHQSLFQWVNSSYQ